MTQHDKDYEKERATTEKTGNLEVKKAQAGQQAADEKAQGELSKELLEAKGNKVLTMESAWKGQFEVKDSKGRKIAQGFERPLTSCYASARIHGSKEGEIIDGFGKEFETLEEAEKKVRAFFEKHGFSFQE